MEDQDDQTCLVAGISVSFQTQYFYYVNWFAPITLLLSIWCFVSNAAVIVTLLRSGIKSIRPGLLMLCSLSFTDLLRSATSTFTVCTFRLKHLLNNQVCQVYSEIETMPMFSRALVACIAVWTVSITSGFVREVAGQQSTLKNFLLPAISIPSVAIIVILQIMTIRLLRRHNRAVADMMEEGNAANPTANTANAAIERRLSKITTNVVGVLALIFVPVAFINILTVVTKTKYIELLGPVLSPLTILWSSINPVLYYRGNEKVKQVIVRLVKCQ